MTAFSTISATLGIRHGEGRLVLLTFCLFVCGGLGRAFANSAAYSLFLAQFDSSTIPYIYIATGVLTAAIMFFYLRLSNRFTLTQLTSMNLVFAGSVTFVFWLLLMFSNSRWLALALPIWYECFVVLLPLALWGFASSLYTVRQSKRLFGLVGSGLPLGFILSGAVTPWLVRWMGTPYLLLASVISIAAILLLVLRMASLYRAELAGNKGPNKQARRAATGDLWRNRYVLLLFALLACWTLASFFVDNIYLNRVSARFPTEEELASFLGIYSIARGTLMLVVGVFVTGPFLNRFGVRVGVLVLPIALAIATLPLVLAGSIWGLIPLLFWPALAAKLTVYGGDPIDRASFGVLYQPLSPSLRMRVPTLAEGMVQPMMIGIAGLLLLFLTTVARFSVVQLGFSLLIVLGIWVVMAVTMGRAYTGALMDALLRRRLGDEQISLTDESSRAVLQEGLRSPKPDVVIYALNRLEETGDPALATELATLLDHSVPVVRLDVARRIERLGMAAAIPAVQARSVVEPEPAVRGALLRTLAALDGDQAYDRLIPELAAGDAEIRRAAATGLLRYGGIGGVLAAGQQVLRWADSADAEERKTTAQVLGDTADNHFYQPLILLLGDPEPAVRAAAIAAAGQVCAPRLWPLVIEQMKVQSLWQACAAALISGGSAAIPAIASALEAPGQPRSVRLRLAQVCGRIRSPEAGLLLKTLIADQDPGVRGAALQALQRAGYQARPEEAAAVHKAMRREGNNATWTLAALIDVDRLPESELLRRALELELDRQRARMLNLLSFIADAGSVQRAQEILSAPRATTEQRAYAQEILDIVTPPAFKAMLLPLVDDLPLAQRFQRLNAQLPQNPYSQMGRLMALVADEGAHVAPWTAACAVDLLARLGGVETSSAIAAAAQSNEPLIRDTACRALAQRAAMAGSNGVPTREEGFMLSTLERVMILKTASIFAAVPDDVLAAVAGVLEEIDAPAGTPIFAKGDLGQAMYVIVAGKVRVHDGVQTLTHLVARDVFGEMALLDAEPRSASVTAEEETLLLCLHQDEFFDLLEDHGAIARGIIQVLSQRLRARSEEVAQLRAKAG